MQGDDTYEHNIAGSGSEVDKETFPGSWGESSTVGVEEVRLTGSPSGGGPLSS
tara:strand:- start:1189 stop:1347 length:159 start_codon:yes stop_codon:yes gene_type:complete